MGLEGLSEKQNTVAAIADVNDVGPQKLGINLRTDADMTGRTEFLSCFGQGNPSSRLGDHMVARQ